MEHCERGLEEEVSDAAEEWQVELIGFRKVSLPKALTDGGGELSVLKGVEAKEAELLLLEAAKLLSV